jgi:hypothetical protein
LYRFPPFEAAVPEKMGRWWRMEEGGGTWLAAVARRRGGKGSPAANTSVELMQVIAIPLTLAPPTPSCRIAAPAGLLESTEHEEEEEQLEEKALGRY